MGKSALPPAVRNQLSENRGVLSQSFCVQPARLRQRDSVCCHSPGDMDAAVLPGFAGTQGNHCHDLEELCFFKFFWDYSYIFSPSLSSPQTLPCTPHLVPFQIYLLSLFIFYYSLALPLSLLHPGYIWSFHTCLSSVKTLSGLFSQKILTPCLRVSIPVKWHHDHGNSYKAKHLTGVG